MYSEAFDEPISLDNDNLLLRGSTLRNTDFVIGAIVYQGHDSKVMKNNSEPVAKFTKLEKMMNQSIGVTFVIQLLMCFILAFLLIM